MYSSQRESPEKFPCHTPILWTVVLVAFGLRLWRVLNTWCIGTDGEFFLWIAEDWIAGDYLNAISNHVGYHPLYPALIGYASWITGDLARAAFAISVVLSTVTILPLYWLVADIWTSRVALLTAFLYAVHPRFIVVGADTMTEGTFLCFFFSAVALYWFAWRRERPWIAIFAGICGSAAYLTRVEGIYLALGFTAFSGLSAAILFFKRAPGRAATALLGLLLAGVSFGACSFPYLLKIRERSGRWHITMKSSVPGAFVEQDWSAFRRIAREHPQPARSEKPRGVAKWKRDHGPLVGAARGFLKYWVRSGEFFIAIVVLGALLAVFSARLRGSLAGNLYLILWAGGFFASIYLALALWRNDIDARYFLGGWLALLAWGGVALEWIFRKITALRSATWRRVLVCGCLAILASPAVHRVAQRHRYDQALVREAGRIARELFAAGVEPRVLATRQKFAYYSGSRASRDLPPAHGTYEFMVAVARELRFPVLAGFEKDFLENDPLWKAKLARGDLEPIDVPNPDPAHIEDVLVYRVKGVPLSDESDERLDRP